METSNEMELIKKNKDNYYIWIDSNINSKENSEYAKTLSKIYKHLILFNKIEDAIRFIKNLQYHLTYIIISGSLFSEYLAKFKNIQNNISIAPKLIIFTSKMTKEKIKTLNEINDPFYNIGGIAISFEEIKMFLNKNIYGKELNFVRPLRRDLLQTGGDFSFKIIEKKNELIGPVYLSDLIIKPNKSEFKSFDKYLIDNYGDIMKELISQIYCVDCPEAVRIKFWLRAYTLETDFYKDMNNDLMKGQSKLYLPYIKLLYSGINNNSITVNVSNNLYRGALIHKKEINNLINLLKNRKNLDIPFAIIKCKSFMSFSLDKNIALNFMNKKDLTETTIRVLYILKAEPFLDRKNITNADLNGISYFNNEKEILLFPFSVYEICDIKKGDNYYKIYLSYLAKYKEFFKIDNQTLLYDYIFNSEFAKELKLAGLSIPIWLVNKSLCKIIIHSNSISIYGSGFCCLIPIPNTMYRIPVLITANHVLREEDIKIGNKIRIEFGDDVESFTLTIIKDTKIFTNQNFDITIIEIKKESEQFSKSIFIDIDEDVFNSEEYLKKYFHKKRAYILEYTESKPYNFDNYEQMNKYTKQKIFKDIIGDKKFSIQEGDITYDGREIVHNIPTNKGASGGPIISVDKFKVIGYHLGKNIYRKEGCGHLLKYPIKEFIKRFYSGNKL